MKVGVHFDPVSSPAFGVAVRGGSGNAFGACLPDTRPTTERALNAPIAVLAPALLAEQQTEVRAAQDDRARRRAHQILRLLGRLQASMLGGGDAGAAVAELSGCLAAVGQCADPSLRSLLSMVETRARIELVRSRS